jgi:hypothetical protein
MITPDLVMGLGVGLSVGFVIGAGAGWLQGAKALATSPKTLRDLPEPVAVAPIKRPTLEEVDPVELQNYANAVAEETGRAVYEELQEELDAYRKGDRVKS